LCGLVHHRFRVGILCAHFLGLVSALYELLPKVNDLFSELIDDLGVVRDVKLYIEHVALDYGLDLFRSIRILKGIQGVLIGCKSR
jgi:hypothetical protein